MTGINRRRFLLAVSVCFVAPAFETAAQRRRARDAGTPRFIELSRVLTGVQELDATLAARGLVAVRSDRARARHLTELWTTAGFDSAAPPTSVQDLAARGVYAK